MVVQRGGWENYNLSTLPEMPQHKPMSSGCMRYEVSESRGAL